MAQVTMTDEMVVAAAEGDSSQRQVLFDHMTPLVRTMVSARLNPTPAQMDLVDDLVQETMLALSEGLTSLRCRTAAAMRAFASTIVSRKVADALADKARMRRAGQGRAFRSLDSTVNGDCSAPGVIRLWATLSDSGGTPASAVGQAEMFQRVISSLSQLKEEHRTIITLAFFDQLETRDIAERLGVTRPAAAMLLMRAVRTLRRNLTGASQFLPVTAGPVNGDPTDPLDPDV